MNCGCSSPKKGRLSQSRQFAQVRGHHRLWAAPHQKEQRFAAPAAGGMAGDVAGAFGGRQRRLGGTQHQAVSAGSQIIGRAGFDAGGQRQEIGFDLNVFGLLKLIDRQARPGNPRRLTCSV